MTLARCGWSLLCAAALIGCPGRGPDLQIVGESTRVRDGDPIPTVTPWFDGATVHLVAARGETLGLQIRHRGGGAVSLDVPGVSIRAFDVELFPVDRPSTALYGRGKGGGAYADGLKTADRYSSGTDPAAFEIAVPRDARPGRTLGELTVAGRRVPVELAVSPVVLVPLAPSVWAYEDPRELVWRFGAAGADAAERSCIALFARHGVLLSPDITLAEWPARRELVAASPFVPVAIPDDPALVGPVVRDFIAATRATGQVPFAIPIDEPRAGADWARVRALGAAVHAAGGGPGRFLLAVTDVPRQEYGDAVDLFLSARAPHLDGDIVPRWTYNGRPPEAGAMVLDGETPGTRTWGWIAWRWRVPLWYVWDALYWHDRHNRHGAPLPGRALEPAVDPVSFDEGDDHGNLDGVLALPGDGGCRPTLRLWALRRGLLDRQLLELASRCDAGRTSALAERMVPRALGDATGDTPSWPSDEASWERARRELIDIAGACVREPGSGTGSSPPP